MRVLDRNGNEIISNEGQNNLLKGMYGSVMGRSVLKVLTLPFISNLGGMVMNSSLSKIAISSFVKNNNIDMNQYEDTEYKSYNQFFTRNIKEGKRKIDFDENHLISPADSKISCYNIDDSTHFLIKDTLYSIEELLEDGELSKKYKGGILGNIIWVFGLSLHTGVIWFDYAQLVVYGIFYGIFIGSLIFSLAENLKVIPIFFRRAKITKGLAALVLAYAVGKGIGNILYSVLNLGAGG